ncbi:unnamed protein product, partial [Sphacelaria rigidula]
MEAAAAGGRSIPLKLFGAQFQHPESNERFARNGRSSLPAVHSRTSSMPVVGGAVYSGVGDSVGSVGGGSTGGKKRRSLFRFLGGRKHSGGSATTQEYSAPGLAVDSTVGSR